MSDDQRGSYSNLTGDISRGIGSVYEVPLFKQSAPWITGYTKPKHRIRYAMWRLIGNVAHYLGNRGTDIAEAAFDAASDAGPQPIIDADKIPTTVTLAWYEDPEYFDRWLH